MDRIEPAADATGQASAASACAHEDAPHSFDVRFSIKPRDAGVLSASRYALHMKGTLTVDGEQIVLRPARHQPARVVSREEVFDIDFADGQLLFDLHTPQRAVERVALIPAELDDLRRIVELLPV